MPKVGISFLGTGNYQETNYKYIDKICTTKYFPKAFASFFEFEILFLVVTEEAKTKHLKKH